MTSIRVKFIRGEEVKYISHLDLMKAVERTLRRTGLPIAYSQGFNPHPQMVFGLPLSVGVASEAEYADFELSEEVNPLVFMEKMNGELPRGIRIIDAAVKRNKGNIMASIAGAIYEIILYLNEDMNIEEMGKRISSFLANDRIIVQKEGKAGIRDMDIKPMIIKLETASKEQLPAGYENFMSAFRFSAFLKAGSVCNLKPELLITALANTAGINIGAATIRRIALFVEKDEKMVDPLDTTILA